MIVAVIPARGGSKRIPVKNIRLFAGKPIISYSITAARECGLFDRIIVSTDDEQVASVAREYGAETPFVRPGALADDHTGTNAVVAHALKWLSDAGTPVQFACCIYATSPFLTPGVLKRGFDAMKNSGKRYAFSVSGFRSPVLRALRILPEGGIVPMFPEFIGSRSQDLEPAYRDAAQFYWGYAEAFCNDESLFSGQAEAVILPRHQVLDIDTPEDWAQAELMYAALTTMRVVDRRTD